MSMPQQPPYAQPQPSQAQPYPVQQPPKTGLSGWRLALALFGAWVVGVVSMIAFAFIFDALFPEEEVASAQLGDSAAVRHLDDQGIMLEPETYSKIANVVCDGVNSGSTGSSLVSAVEESIGLSRMDASEVVAASVVYSCQDQIGKLAR